MLPRIITSLVLVSSVLAANSGIFQDSGAVSPGPAAGDDPYSHSEHVRSAPVKRESNADRMRRGLGPNPPTRRRSALLPSTSIIPCYVPTITTQGHPEGYIAVLSTTGTTLGYISSTYDDQNSLTYTTSITSALVIRLPDSNYCNTPIDITAVHPPDSTFPILGAVGGSAGYNIQSGQFGYAYLSGVGHTGAGSPASSAGNSIQSLGYDAPSESQIWTLNDSLEITTTWYSNDGTPVPTTIFYDPTVDFLGITGGLDAFNSVFPSEGAFAVTFHLIPTGA